MNEYDIGDMVRVTGTFKNFAGAVTDPTVVQFKYRLGNGTVTTYVYGTDAQVVKDSTGIYHVDITIDARGLWHYRFTGTGTVVAAGEGTFSAVPHSFFS